jgi:hypothetical protein
MVGFALGNLGLVALWKTCGVSILFLSILEEASCRVCVRVGKGLAFLVDFVLVANRGKPFPFPCSRFPGFVRWFVMVVQGLQQLLKLRNGVEERPVGTRHKACEGESEDAGREGERERGEWGRCSSRVVPSAD